MRKVYHCPQCNGTEVKYSYSLKKGVCPRDNTPLSEFLPVEEE